MCTLSHTLTLPVSVVEIMGNTTLAWRHWGCVTSRVLANMKNSLPEAEDLVSDLLCRDCAPRLTHHTGRL
jgi:hypothetical protein